MSDGARRTHRGKHARPRRRDVLAAIAALGGAAAVPRLARARRRATATIGILYAGTADSLYRTDSPFRRGLAEMGYAEGRNVTFEVRAANFESPLLPALAQDLVRREVDVIWAPGNAQSVLIAKAATDTIPIVFSNSGDPIKAGLVASLAHPGGNVTGISDFGSDLSAKRVEFIKLLIPAASVIALLVRRNTPEGARNAEDARERARSLGVDTFDVGVSTADEIDAVFAGLTQRRVDGLCVIPNVLFANRHAQIIAAAAHARVPAAYPLTQFAEAGGLMSYGTSLAERSREAGLYVGLILNGQKPSDLPVRRLTKFELAINLTTAKALGLAVPPTFLALADKVIE